MKLTLWVVLSCTAEGLVSWCQVARLASPQQFSCPISCYAPKCSSPSSRYSSESLAAGTDVSLTPIHGTEPCASDSRIVHGYARIKFDHVVHKLPAKSYTQRTSSRHWLSCFYNKHSNAVYRSRWSRGSPLQICEVSPTEVLACHEISNFIHNLLKLPYSMPYQCTLWVDMLRKAVMSSRSR